MKSIREKLQEEFDNLNEKSRKLDSFIGSSRFHELSQIQKSLLIVQSGAMETYALCLYERIDNL